MNQSLKSLGRSVLPSLIIHLALLGSLITGCFLAIPQGHVVAAGKGGTLETKIAETDWAKVRGANFIPSYASNSYEIWRNYNHDTFDSELRLASDVGYNSVRLWLNYEAYAELGSKMVDNVQDALRLC